MNRLMMFFATVALTFGAGGLARSAESQTLNLDNPEEEKMFAERQASALDDCVKNSHKDCEKVAVVAAAQYMLGYKACRKVPRDDAACRTEADLAANNFLSGIYSCQEKDLSGCDPKKVAEEQRKAAKAPKAPKQTSSATDIPAADLNAPHPRIWIYNASGVQGDAAVTDELLQKHGYPKATTENWKGDKWPKTAVDCKEAYEDDCVKIRNILNKERGLVIKGTHEKQTPAMAWDIRIILGTDRKAETPPVVGEPPKEPTLVTTEKKRDESANFLKDHPWILKIPNMFAVGVQAGASGLWSYPGPGMSLIPQPVGTVAFPAFRLTVDSIPGTDFDAVPFVISIAPLFNASFRPDPLLQGGTTPLGIGARLGGEVYLKPLRMWPVTDDVRDTGCMEYEDGISKRKSEWCPSSHLFLGAYAGVEGMSTLFRPAGLADGAPWGQHYLLGRGGLSLRFDWASWGSIIAQAGGVAGGKYQRFKGWHDHTVAGFPGWTVFPVLGLEANLQIVLRFPDLSDFWTGK